MEEEQDIRLKRLHQFIFITIQKQHKTRKNHIENFCMNKNKLYCVKIVKIHKNAVGISNKMY